MGKHCSQLRRATTLGVSITPDELVWHNEQPLLVGAFGVPKPGRKVSKSGSPVLRLIMNAIPVNAVQSLIHGDIRSLTMANSHGNSRWGTSWLR